MHYDLAAKVILSRCKEAVLSVLCGLPVTFVLPVEGSPQETPSVRRSDFVFRATFNDGTERLVLLEFLSYWKPWIPLRTLECRCRHILQEHLPVVSVILLLTPAGGISDHYEDEEVRYRYRLVKIYEFEAREILQKGPECLLAFIPLMKGGEELIEEAERKIYEGKYSREEKADLLTGMAILGGLISREIPLKLITRRRDIMIESAAYEIIKKEGFEEGLREGIQQGIQQGSVEEAREMVLEALEERFGLLPRAIISKIKEIEEREILRALLRLAIRVENLEEFSSHLERLEK